MGLISILFHKLSSKEKNIGGARIRTRGYWVGSNSPPCPNESQLVPTVWRRTQRIYLFHFQTTTRRRLRPRPSTTTHLRSASARRRPSARGWGRPTWTPTSSPTPSLPSSDGTSTSSGYGTTRPSCSNESGRSFLSPTWGRKKETVLFFIEWMLSYFFPKNLVWSFFVFVCRCCDDLFWRPQAFHW